MTRFAISLHQIGSGSRALPGDAIARDHFDWFFEREDSASTSLLTFSSDLDGESFSRRADHRSRYLAYEGPISDARGHVTRWYVGDFEWLSHVDDSIYAMRLQSVRRQHGSVNRFPWLVNGSHITLSRANDDAAWQLLVK